MRDVVRDRAVEKIHEAVEEAIGAGMTPRQFVVEAQQSWEQVLTDAVKAAISQFASLLERRPQ